MGRSVFSCMPHFISVRCGLCPKDTKRAQRLVTHAKISNTMKTNANDCAAVNPALKIKIFFNFYLTEAIKVHLQYETGESSIRARHNTHQGSVGRCDLHKYNFIKAAALLEKSARDQEYC